MPTNEDAPPLRDRDRERPKPGLAPARQSLLAVGRVASRLGTSGISRLSKANSFLRAKPVTDATVNASPWGVGVAASPRSPGDQSRSSTSTTPRDSASDREKTRLSTVTSPSGSERFSEVLSPAYTDTIVSISTGPSDTRSLASPRVISLRPPGVSPRMFVPTDAPRSVDKTAATTPTDDRRKSQRKDARGVNLLSAGGAAAWGLVRSVSRRTIRNTTPTVDNRLNAIKKDNVVDRAGEEKLHRTKSAAKTGSGAWVDPEQLLRSRSSVVFSSSSGTESVVRGQSGSQSTMSSYAKTNQAEVDIHSATIGAKEEIVGTAALTRANAVNENVSPKDKSAGSRKSEEGTGDMGGRPSRANISGIFAKLGGGQLFRSTKNGEDAGSEPFKKQRSGRAGENSKNSDRRRRNAEAMHRRRKLRPSWLVGLGESGSRVKREESERGRIGTAASSRSPKAPGEIDFVDDEFFDSEEDDDLNGAAAPRSLLNDDFIAYQTRKKGANNNRGRVRNWGRQ